jgi:hypothetical protein
MAWAWGSLAAEASVLALALSLSVFVVWVCQVVRCSISCRKLKNPLLAGRGFDERDLGALAVT